MASLWGSWSYWTEMSTICAVSALTASPQLEIWLWGSGQGPSPGPRSCSIPAALLVPICDPEPSHHPVLMLQSDPGSPHCAWFPKYLFRQTKPRHWNEVYIDSSPLMLTLEFHRVWLGYPFTPLLVNSVPNLLKTNNENKFCYQEKDNTNKPRTVTVQNRQTEDLTWKIYGLHPAVFLMEAPDLDLVVKYFYYK